MVARILQIIKAKAMIASIVSKKYKVVFWHGYRAQHNISGQDSTSVESTAHLLQAYMSWSFKQGCQGYL